MRVAHATTKATGDAGPLVASLSPYDDSGPWRWVEFDDGLRCYVPVTELKYIALAPAALAVVN